MREKFDAFRERWTKMPIVEKILIAFFAGFLLSAFLFAKIPGIIATGDFSVSYGKSLFYSFTTKLGLIINAICGVLILIASAFLGKKSSDLDATASVDERGMRVSTEGTYGTADWMSKEEAKKTYEVCSAAESNGTILGQFTENGEEIIALPYKKGANRNLILIGPPGSGKSFGYVRTAVFQSMKREESIVVTDPKGEIHNDMRRLLESKGYVVKVFNLINLKKSDAWDCAKEIYDPRTGDIDEQRAVVFCETIMKNTGGDDDAFWGDGEKNLLKVAVLYTAFVRESSLKLLYLQAVSVKLNETDIISEEDKEKALAIMNDPETEMNVRRELAVHISSLVLGSTEEGEAYVKSKEALAPTCTISDIYYALLHNTLEDWEQKFNKNSGSGSVPLSHPAASAWAIFRKASDKVQPGFIVGIGQRLQLFQMRDVRRITSNDDIRLEDIGARKTALFLVISDDNAAMQLLSSLMFSFLLKDLKEAHDYCSGKGRIPVNIIADEAPNTGTWPQFEKTIATARSRDIGISIILQSLPQLSMLYGEDIAEIIIGCCNTILVLGCNDEYTANYISKLSGIVTIRAKSIKEDRSNDMGIRHLNQGYSLSDGDGKRNLMNPDEVRTLDREEILIYSNGVHLLKAKRFGFINHPYASDPNFVPTTWSELPSAKEKYAESELMDAFVRNEGGTVSTVADIQTKKESNEQHVKDVFEKQREEAAERSLQTSIEKETAGDVGKMLDSNKGRKNGKNTFGRNH